MAWYNWLKPKPTPKPKNISQPGYSGPIQPGTSEEVFRETGKSVPTNQTYSGPVQSGSSASTFRTTGSSGTSSAYSGTTTKLNNNNYNVATKTNIAKPTPPSLSQVQQESNVVMPQGAEYNIQQDKLRAQNQKVSRQDLQPTSNIPQDYKVVYEDILIQKKIDTYKGVPVYKIYFRPAFGSERPATVEEEKHFREQTNIYQSPNGNIVRPKIFTGLDVKLQQIKGGGSNISQSLKGATGIIAETSSGVTGITLKEFQKETSETAEIFRGSDKAIVRGLAKPYELIGGTASGGLKLFRDKPLAAGATIGAGVLIRVAVGGLTTATSFIPGTTGTFIRTVGSGGLLAGSGVLLGMEAKNVYTEIQAKESYFGKGEIIGESLTELRLFTGGYAGGKSIYLKSADAFRVRNLKEIPMKDIVAPEFLEGQRIPSIKKGQTAGELLGEFKEPIFIEEFNNINFKGAFFTASQKRGLQSHLDRPKVNYIPVTFGAPRLSPAFLGITPEARPRFTFDLFGETTSPGIFRITPTEFRLIPGVSSGETIPSGGLAKGTQKVTSKRAKEIFEFFSEGKAEKGVSYVPFVKTEKEAGIVLGSEYLQKPTRFYTTYAGRKIPILEYQTAESGNIKYRLGGLKPKEDLAKISQAELQSALSDSKVGRKGSVVSSDVPLKYTSRISSGTSSSTSSVASSITSSTPSKVGSKIPSYPESSTPSKVGSKIPSYPESSTPKSITSSYSKTTSYPQGSSYTSDYTKGYSTVDYTKTPPPIIPFFPMGGLGSLGVKKYSGKKRYKYSPSFEVITGFAKGSTKKKKRFTGLEIRGIPKGFTWAFKSPSKAFRKRAVSMANFNFYNPYSKSKKKKKKRK